MKNALRSSDREKPDLLGNPRATNASMPNLTGTTFITRSEPAQAADPGCYGVIGSTSVNAIMKDALPAVSERYQILFVTGKNNYEEMRKQIHAPHVKVVDYVKQLDIMAHVDLIVCRAGATTAAEITALGTPSILVPSPMLPITISL